MQLFYYVSISLYKCYIAVFSKKLIQKRLNISIQHSKMGLFHGPIIAQIFPKMHSMGHGIQNFQKFPFVVPPPMLNTYGARAYMYSREQTLVSRSWNTQPPKYNHLSALITTQPPGHPLPVQSIHTPTSINHSCCETNKSVYNRR